MAHGGHGHGLTFDEARARMREWAVRPPAVVVPLDQLAGRVLAEDVRARVDHPAFDNSAMDGFAARADDLRRGRAVRVVGESRAGAPFPGAIGPGEAVRISTGAQVPAGADAVLRAEDAREHADAVVAVTAPTPGTSIRRRGEDVRASQVLLPAGHRVAPHEVVVVAAAGHATVRCRRRPRVVVVGSGDELVPPGANPGPGEIFDSNRAGVAAQAVAAGAEVVASLVVPDDRAVTEATLRAVLDGGHGPPPPDLLVTIGGVSVGPHDHLRPALAACGVREVFFGAAIRPGHPIWLGQREGRPVLGLPGNPVSATVCFHAFGRELLGLEDEWDERLPLGADYAARTQRTELVRCRQVDGALHPLPRQGSHAVTSLAGATHLAIIPGDRHAVAAGEPVRASRLA